MELDTLPEAAEPPTIKAWWTQVAALGCLITGKPNPTIHHIHGGSLADEGHHSGWALRGISDYLVIPLAAELHTTSSEGIDGGKGVQSWEAEHGTQVELMDRVCRLTGQNAWRWAGIERDPWG